MLQPCVRCYPYPHNPLFVGLKEMVKSVQLLRVGFWTACFSVENKTEIPAEGNAADADKKTE